MPDGWEMSWPSGYVSLLRAARPALRSADPKARVVLGGMSGESWSHLRELYNAGARKLFDVAAIHPHSSSVKDALITARLTRKVMRRARDKRKPLWITELGWPAARGKQPADEGLQRLTTTPSGMAARMKKIYGKLVRTRKSKKYGVSRVFWFTWATGYKPSTETGIWDFAGLVWSAGPAFILTPALKVYRGSARRYQGCAKTILGRCAH